MASIPAINFLTLFVFGIYIFIFALVIIVLIRLSRYFYSAGKEQKLMRMELSKLADEVSQIRKHLKENEKNPVG